MILKILNPTQRTSAKPNNLGPSGKDLALRGGAEGASVDIRLD